MAAPVFVDGVTPLNAANFNALGAEVNGKVALPGGAVANGQWLKGSGGAVVWSAITPADVGLPKITTQALASGPPASPADGDIWIATAVDGAGTVWQFRYNAGSASPYKWEFIGGSPMRYGHVAGENTASTVYVNLATVDTLSIPRSGDYDVSFGCEFYSASGVQLTGYQNLNTFGGGPGDTGYNLQGVVQPAGYGGVVASTTTLAGLVQAWTLVLQYKASGGTLGVIQRFLRVLPIRIA